MVTFFSLDLSYTGRRTLTRLSIRVSLKWLLSLWLLKLRLSLLLTISKRDIRCLISLRKLGLLGSGTRGVDSGVSGTRIRWRRTTKVICAGTLTLVLGMTLLAMLLAGRICSSNSLLHRSVAEKSVGALVDSVHDRCNVAFEVGTANGSLPDGVTVLRGDDRLCKEDDDIGKDCS